MALTAKEWLLLSKEEQEKREKELSPHECYLLRSLYDHCHFTEEQKNNMTQEEKEEFLREPTKKEQEASIKSQEEILRGWGLLEAGEILDDWYDK